MPLDVWLMKFLQPNLGIYFGTVQLGNSTTAPECTPRLSRIQSSGLLRKPVKVFVASTVYPCRVTEQHSSARTHCLGSKLLAYPLSLFHLLSFSSETLSSQQLPPVHGLLVQTSLLAACFGASLLWVVASLGLHCYHLVHCLSELEITMQEDCDVTAQLSC